MFNKVKMSSNNPKHKNNRKRRSIVDDEMELLRKQLAAKEKIIADKDKVIADEKKKNADKDKVIADKDKQIKGEIWVLLNQAPQFIKIKPKSSRISVATNENDVKSNKKKLTVPSTQNNENWPQPGIVSNGNLRKIKNPTGKKSAVVLMQHFGIYPLANCIKECPNEASLPVENCLVHVLQNAMTCSDIETGNKWLFESGEVKVYTEIFDDKTALRPDYVITYGNKPVIVVEAKHPSIFGYEDYMCECPLSIEEIWSKEANSAS